MRLRIIHKILLSFFVIVMIYVSLHLFTGHVITTETENLITRAKIIDESHQLAIATSELFDLTKDYLLSEGIQGQEEFRAARDSKMDELHSILDHLEDAEVEQQSLDFIREKITEGSTIIDALADNHDLLVDSTTEEQATLMKQNEQSHLSEINAIQTETKTAIYSVIRTTDVNFEQALAVHDRFMLIIPVVSVFVFVLSIVLALLIARSLSKPVRGLTGAAKELQKGNLDAEIEIKSKDEIGELAQAFDEMRLDLKDRNDLLNSLLVGFEGKAGKLATIVMRKTVGELVRRNPRIMKIIPENLARSIENEQELKNG